MPVYEYRCNRCQQTYESIRPFSKRDDPAPCPECGESGERQLSVFGFKDGRYGHFPKAGRPSTASSKPKDKPNQ